MATREELKETIDQLCEEAGCSDKIRKIHFDQYVNHKWHPHPPKDFQDWWSRHDHAKQDIEAKRAWNCQNYRDEFMEAKQVGTVSTPRVASNPLQQAAPWYDQ